MHDSDERIGVVTAKYVMRWPWIDTNWAEQQSGTASLIEMALVP